MKYARILFICILFAFTSCSKGGGSSPTPPTPPTPPTLSDPAIVFAVDIDPGGEKPIFKALGPSQPMVVNISSALPTNGVIIKVTVTNDNNNNQTVYTSGDVPSSKSSNSFTINSIPNGAFCTTTILVKSANPNSTNIVERKFGLYLF